MNLTQWLEYLEQCHPSTIELGLDRISQVAEKLPIDFSNTRIITVAGTNGKGSTVSMLSAILEKGGYRTACYTSPHILHYNERVRLGSDLATDDELCNSFAAVEAVRGDVKLTYFEFGTLAALQIFSAYKPDFIILEVGLGGRLDAVNILDPDLAILTNVAIDHTDWLGTTREAIGFEKAGIFRSDKPALIGEKDIPQTVLSHASDIKANVYRNGDHFSANANNTGSWEWQGAGTSNAKVSYSDLPFNDFPLDNCAAVLQAISLLTPEISRDQIVQGLTSAALPGRFQVIDKGYPLILDVAHNPHAAARLVTMMQARFPDTQVHLVIAMLSDKDFRKVLEQFRQLSPIWYVAGIQDTRGLEAKMLYNCLLESGEQKVVCFTTIGEAFTAANEAVIEAEKAQQHDSVLLVSGSFFTVSAVLEMI